MLPKINMSSIKRHRKASLPVDFASQHNNARGNGQLENKAQNTAQNFNGNSIFKRDTSLPIESGTIGAGYARSSNQNQLHDLKKAGRNLYKNFNSNDQTLKKNDNAYIEDQKIEIGQDPRSNTVFRNSLIQTVKNAEIAKKQQGTVGRHRRTIHLSSNMWDGLHQRKLSKTTLKELPGVKMSPRNEKLPMMTGELKTQSKRFMNKIVSEVPKGQINYADTIGFLERIITN